MAQSTAEAELIGYCESLVAGRATAALLEVILGELLTQKRIYGERGGDSLGELADETFEDPGGIVAMGAGRWWVVTHASVGEADGVTKSLNGQAFERFREDLGMPVGKKMVKRAGVNQKEQEIAAGSSCLGVKAKLLAVIGADLVGKVMANGDGRKVDEVDTLIATGIILMVIGALWLAKETGWICEKAEEDQGGGSPEAGPGWCLKMR